jgi:hypothetical protein
LRLAVFEDLEILPGQAGDDGALAIGDRDAKGGEIDAGAELLVYPPKGGHHRGVYPPNGGHALKLPVVSGFSRIDSESNQDHSDQPSAGGHLAILAGV